MAGEIIRPTALPDRPSPVASEKLPVDNGSNVGGATIKSIVEAGRPAASQLEAETGTDPSKAMTPLTTAQAIDARVPGIVNPIIELLGLGDLATKDTVNNADWSGADLTIENGGTGASTPEAARTALNVPSVAEAQALAQAVVPIYDAAADMPSVQVPANINTIEVNGQAVAGDGLGGKAIDTDNGAGVWFVSGGATARNWYFAPSAVRDVADDLRQIEAPYLYKGAMADIPSRNYRFEPDNSMADNAVAILRPAGIDANDPGRWVLQPGTFEETFQLTFGNVGSGADFTDLEEALRFCSRLRPEYAYGRSSNGRCINLRVLAGTIITQGIALARGQDLGHVRIVSDDAIVPVNFPTDVWWAYAEYNSRLPLFSTIFDMQGIGYDGVALKHGSAVCFEYLTALPPFAGIINAARHNVFINTDSHGAFRKGRFTGAVGNGIHFEKGCHGSAREADVSGCGAFGIYLLSDCHIDAHLINAADCLTGIKAELGSSAAAFGANVSRSRSYALHAFSGSRIIAPDAVILESEGYGAVADKDGSFIGCSGSTYSLKGGITPPNGNFLASNGADMNAQNINLTGITASASNFRVLGNSTMRLAGSTGTTNITPNAAPNSNGQIIK